MPKGIGQAIGHRLYVRPWALPKIAWAMVPTKASWGQGPGAHGLTYGPWACPMSYGMPYVLWHVLCPMSHGPVLCPVALTWSRVRAQRTTQHEP